MRSLNFSVVWFVSHPVATRLLAHAVKRMHWQRWPAGTTHHAGVGRLSVSEQKWSLWPFKGMGFNYGYDQRHGT